MAIKDVVTLGFGSFASSPLLVTTLGFSLTGAIPEIDQPTRVVVNPRSIVASVTALAMRAAVSGSAERTRVEVTS